MDKDHLVELISSTLIYETNDHKSNENNKEFKNYLERLNLEQLRTMSKEFIL